MNDIHNPEEEIPGAEGRLERTLELLADWIMTENWEASKQYLVEHKAELLSDEALAAMLHICRKEPEQVNFQMHLFLLHQSRSTNIENAYAEFQREMRQAASEVQRESQHSRQIKHRREAPEKKKRFGEELETPIQLILLVIFVIWLIGWAWPEFRDGEVDRVVHSIENMDPAEVTKIALDEGYLTEDEVAQIWADTQRTVDSLHNSALFDEEVKKQQEETIRSLDSAYQQLLESSAHGYLSSVADSAEMFLMLADSHQDPRVEEVIDLYSSALVALIARQGPLPDEKIAVATQSYRHLVVAPELLQEAVGLAATGHIGDALAAVKTAQNYDPELDISANVWSDLCLWGGLWGQAEMTISACDAAVNDSDPNHRALYQGNRGISRAELGDYVGAMSDFEAFALVQRTGDGNPTFQVPQQWIQMLGSNQNPFTTNALADLRSEVYKSLGLSSPSPD